MLRVGRHPIGKIDPGELSQVVMETWSMSGCYVSFLSNT